MRGPKGITGLTGKCDKVHMSLGMAYWSAIQPELVVERTGIGMVVTPRVESQ